MFFMRSPALLVFVSNSQYESWRWAVKVDLMFKDRG